MIEQTVGQFRRRVEFDPGFCWPGDFGLKDYGNGSVRLRFVLIGKKGAVQWVVGTEWMPAAARADVHRRRAIHSIGVDDDQGQKPMGYDLGYHSREPQYDGQDIAKDCCEYLNAPCYYDGSGLMADELVEGFLNGGDEWVWEKLECVYESWFEGAEWPDLTPNIQPHPDLKKVS